mgnify:CR=1 FL=1
MGITYEGTYNVLSETNPLKENVMEFSELCCKCNCWRFDKDSKESTSPPIWLPARFLRKYGDAEQLHIKRGMDDLHECELGASLSKSSRYRSRKIVEPEISETTAKRLEIRGSQVQRSGKGIT